MKSTRMNLLLVGLVALMATASHASTLMLGNDYVGADLSGVSCPGIVLDEGLSEFFQGANLSDADLSDAVLAGGGASFQITLFVNANFSGAALSGGAAAFVAADFTNADFSVASLSSSDGTTFQGAVFSNADFSGASLSGGANAFAGGDFTNADFTGATLVTGTGPDTFITATFDNAVFLGADLSGVDATGLARPTFGLATPPKYDSGTIFPAGFDPVANNWMLIPEPASLALLSLAGTAVLVRRRCY